MPADPLVEKALESAAKGDLRPMRLRTGIEAWAEKNGETPKALVTSTRWFAAHPGLADQARTAYNAGWSWDQVRQWLEEEHGYPLKDAKSVSKACR